MLRSVDKYLIENLWECKRLFTRIRIRIGKDKYWTICESCEQLVQSNALEAAVGYGRRLELQKKTFAAVNCDSDVRYDELMTS